LESHGHSFLDCRVGPRVEQPALAARGISATIRGATAGTKADFVTSKQQEHITRLVETLGADPATAHRAASELLPLLYDELKALAKSRMEREAAGPTLQATALVHEAYLRLVGTNDPGWNGRAHFFAAAAEAMRRILVERARSKSRIKRGGDRERVSLGEVATLEGEPDVDVLALDEALTRLASTDPRKAQVVNLRHFAGLTLEETAAALEVSLATVKADWSFARAWLHRELSR
jgi:RNA polymerase sigma factor (TIGR02999 family)